MEEENKNIENNEENNTFGTPIDNGSTSDLRESVNVMQTILDEPTVEGPKANNSKSPIIVIVVLLVIILGLGGYIGYDKVFNNTKCNVDTKDSSKEKYAAYLDSIKDRDYAEYVSFDYMDGEEEKSRKYILGTDNYLYVLDNNEGETIPGAQGNGAEFKGTKTDINEVVRMYEVNHSDGKDSVEDESIGLLLIKEDGFVTIIRHPEKETIKEESLDYSYIVDSYTALTNVSTTVLIDIDGNTFSLK